MYISDSEESASRYIRVLNDDTARARATLSTLFDITLRHVREVPGLSCLEATERQFWTDGSTFAAQHLPEAPDIPYGSNYATVVRHAFTIDITTVEVVTYYPVCARVEGVHTGKRHVFIYKDVLQTNDFTIQGLAQLTAGLHHLHRSLVERFQVQSI